MDLSTATWRKASRSSNNGGNCVELGRAGDVLAIRDSKDPHGPKILLSPSAVQHLAQLLKSA